MLQGGEGETKQRGNEDVGAKATRPVVGSCQATSFPK